MLHFYVEFHVLSALGGRLSLRVASDESNFPMLAALACMAYGMTEITASKQAAATTKKASLLPQAQYRSN